MLKKIGLLIMATVSAFAMHNVELNINDKDLEVGVQLDIAQFNRRTEPNTVFVGFKYLNGDSKNSEHNVDGGDMDPFMEFSFLMKRRVQSSRFSVGLGMKLVNFTDFNALPLGVDLSYKLTTSRALPMSIGGSFYYAPEVLSMQDGTGFYAYRVEYDVEVIPHGHILAGYRDIELEYLNASKYYTYNNSVYIGFKFEF